jgi:hypothetical protein
VELKENAGLGKAAPSLSGHQARTGLEVLAGAEGEACVIHRSTVGCRVVQVGSRCLPA